jgi:hypothetical protein
MSTSNTYRVTLSADMCARWGAEKVTRDRILFTARYHAKQLGQTRIEIVDQAGNILRTVEPPKPAPESARMPFVRHDGGRAASGFKGTASGDCVTRAIATATGKPYREVYDALNALAKRERPRGKTRRSSAANGVHRVTYERYLFGLGFKFVPTMGIGTGTKVHVRADELPEGRLVLSLSRHLAAVVDGKLYDLDDCSRWGTRCVYGYYVAPASLSKAA